MRRVAVTGLGLISCAGLGAEPLARALAEGTPLGALEDVPALRGRSVGVRVARLPTFDRERLVSSRALRRMAESSQMWTIACVLARDDARMDSDAAARYEPRRRGTYLGTGFGGIDATWDYLMGVMRDGAGMGSPFLFSESVANAPAGHSAIEMDTRGASMTFTCGDASAVVAVARAASAIRGGRVDMAYAGGLELIAPSLLRVLATLGVSFAGEGAACLVLEEMAGARARGARILAEVSGWGMASDPGAGDLRWSRDRERLAAAMRRAAAGAPGETASAVSRIFLHGGPDVAGAAAEKDAAAALYPGAGVSCPADVTGSYAASGGFSVAAAVLDVAGQAGHALVSGSSWGGGIAALGVSSL